MFSSTVKQVEQVILKHDADRRANRRVVLSSRWPSSATSPASGFKIVQSMSIVVDLPAPFGPRNANSLPRSR